jgi:hypothetical protein
MIDHYDLNRPLRRLQLQAELLLNACLLCSWHTITANPYFERHYSISYANKPTRRNHLDRRDSSGLTNRTFLD